MSLICTCQHNGRKHREKTSWVHVSRGNLYEVGKKCHQYSIVTLYGIWLFVIKRLCVVFCACGWHFGGLFQTSMYMLFIVLSFCYTLNHQFKGWKKDCWNIYFNLDKYHIFWLHFDLSSSDGKLVKFCIEPQISKVVTKFTVPLLSYNRIWEPKSYTFEHISFELNSQNCGAKMQETIFTQ